MAEKTTMATILPVRLFLAGAILFSCAATGLAQQAVPPVNVKGVEQEFMKMQAMEIQKNTSALTLQSQMQSRMMGERMADNYMQDTMQPYMEEIMRSKMKPQMSQNMKQ